jgi:hypothetical protein
MCYKKNRKARTGDRGTVEERKAYYDSRPKCKHCFYRSDKKGKEVGKDGWKAGLPKAFKDKWKLLEHYNKYHPNLVNEIKHLFSEEEIVTCPICGVFMGQIGHKHLAKHSLTTEEFKNKYPDIAMRPTKMKQVWSDRCKEFNKTDYMRKSVSEANLKRIEERNNKTFKFVGKFYSEKNKKYIYYRSKYELKAIEILENSEEISQYDYEKIRIRYTDQNERRRIYILDFNTNDKIIEVKPSWVIKQKNKYPDIIRKFAAAEKWAKKNGYTFEVWTEKELGLLES